MPYAGRGEAGSTNVPVRLGEDVTQGQHIAIGSDGLGYLACADAAAPRVPSFGIAEIDGAEGETITVIHQGTVDVGSGAGLPPGDLIYLSNTPGEISATAGDVSQIVGMCNSEREYILCLEQIAQQEPPAY